MTKITESLQPFKNLFASGQLLYQVQFTQGFISRKVYLPTKYSRSSPQA